MAYYVSEQARFYIWIGQTKLIRRTKRDVKVKNQGIDSFVKANNISWYKNKEFSWNNYWTRVIGLTSLIGCVKDVQRLPHIVYVGGFSNRW